MIILGFTLLMIVFFAFAMWVKAVAERNKDKYPISCGILLFLTAIVFLPCDVAFQIFPGSLFFWEIKGHGWLFTTRLQWHKAHSDIWSWRYRLAIFFCKILDYIQYKIMRKVHC